VDSPTPANGISKKRPPLLPVRPQVRIQKKKRHLKCRGIVGTKNCSGAGKLIHIQFAAVREEEAAAA